MYITATINTTKHGFASADAFGNKKWTYTTCYWCIDMESPLQSVGDFENLLLHLDYVANNHSSTQIPTKESRYR